MEITDFIKNLLLIVILAILFNSCAKKKKYEDSRTPEESMEAFDILQGFKAEVFAADLRSIRVYRLWQVFKK